MNHSERAAPEHDGAVSAVVLAAGAGTRLGELGRRHSKPMVPVLARPLIEHVMDRLAAAGVHRIVVVGHPSDQALATFLAASHPTIPLVLQHERRGVADALLQALPLLVNDSGYLACACDSLFAADDIAGVIARGRATPARAAVAVLTMGLEATSLRSAVVLAGDRVTAIVEKPPPGTVHSDIVACPLYWLPRELAPCLQEGAASGAERYVTTALNRFIERGGTVHAVRVRYRIEVTTADDVTTAEAWLRRQTK